MKAVIFGAGRALDTFFKNEDIYFSDIVAVIDSNLKRQGEMWKNHKIQSPEILRQIEYDKIIISSTDYYDEIRRDLLTNYSILPEQIMPLGRFVVPNGCNMGDIKVSCDKNMCYTVEELSQYVEHTDNKLSEFFFFESHRIINKWWHYFEVYDTFISRYKEKAVKMLEIGVFKGGSLQMWKNYFGRNATIVGIDIDKGCKNYEEEQIYIRTGSQNDRNFLRKVCDEFGPFDVILDDGSHIMEDQIVSFETLFPLMSDRGIYVCEDTHTSYWHLYGGGLGKSSTFMEYAKRMVDEIHYQYVKQGAEDLRKEYGNEIQSIHFYDSIVVFEKRRRGISFWSKRGSVSE